MRDWVFGSQDWQSIALYNDGNHGFSKVPKGIVFSFPCKVGLNGGVTYLDGLSIDDEVSDKIVGRMINELVFDRNLVEHLLV